MSTPAQRLRKNVTGIVSTLVTGVWLAALFTGQEWWLGFMFVGYVLIVPLTALLFGDREVVMEWWEDEEVTTPEEEDAADPLQTLRHQYARGELTDEEFEHRLERLLETETAESDPRPASRSIDAIDRELDRE